MFLICPVKWTFSWKPEVEGELEEDEFFPFLSLMRCDTFHYVWQKLLLIFLDWGFESATCTKLEFLFMGNCAIMYCIPPSPHFIHMWFAVMLSLCSASYHSDLPKIRQDICARNKKIIRHSVSFIGFSHELHCSPDLRSPYLSQKPWNLQTDFAKALLNFRILIRMLEIFRKAFYDISKYLPWEAF